MINIQKYFEKALDCEKNERPDLALTLYQEILGKDPLHLPSLYNLATLLGKRGQLSQAISHYETLIAAEPDFAQAYYNCGVCYLQQKNVTQAEDYFQEAVALIPQYSPARHMLGLILFKKGLWLEAKYHLEKALEQDPDNGELLNHLGMSCLQAGEEALAEAYLNRSIDLMPYLAEAQYHLGVIHLKRGNTDKAQDHFQQAVDRDPKHFGGWFNLGLIHKKKGQLLIAQDCLAKAQAIQPEDQALAFLQAAIQHSPAFSEAPESFVQALFDQYAPQYEDHMQAGLAYQVPQQLFDLFNEHILAKPQSLTLVDLGCGTGLMGQMLRPYARHLIGMDISSAMLEEARKKNLYDDLQQVNLTTGLSALSPDSIDGILAADVLGYIGALDQLFSMISRALKPGGYCLFSIEKGETSFALSEHLRFTHHPDYIQDLCNRLGFLIVAEKLSILRTEVEGVLYVLQKKPSRSWV